MSARYGVRGLDRLQAMLDAHQEPADWPIDVCRNAWCGHWERNDGLYYPHTSASHNDRSQPMTDEEWRPFADALGIDPPTPNDGSRS